MPFFPDKKILFIHIPKNAGSSVLNFLGDRPGWDLNNQPKVYPPTFSFRSKVKSLLTFRNSADDQKKSTYLFGTGLGSYYLQHATLSEIISLGLLAPSDLQQMRIFCVTRDPYDRIKSIYNYWKFNCIYSFDEFCSKVVNLESRPYENALTHAMRTHLRPQIDFVNIDGTLPPWLEIVEFKKLSIYLDQLGRTYYGTNNAFSSLPRVNKSSANYDFELSNFSKSVIKATYSCDFEAFGYRM